MNYVIEDMAGKKYKVNMNFKKYAMARILLPVSYVLYGLIVTVALEIIGISNDSLLIILIIAYFINILLSFSKKYPSLINLMHALLAAPIINSGIIAFEKQDVEDKTIKIEKVLDNHKIINIFDIFKAVDTCETTKVCNEFLSHYAKKIK